MRIVLPLLLIACEPPDAPDFGGAGEPLVELLNPPADVGTIPLDDQGVLSFLVVADIDNLTWVPPSQDHEDPVDGEGHYHVNINGAYVAAPTLLYYEYASQPGEFTVGQQLQLSVTLAANDHSDLDMYEEWQQVIEFEVGEAEGGGA